MNLPSGPSRYVSAILPVENGIEKVDLLGSEGTAVEDSIDGAESDLSKSNPYPSRFRSRNG